MKTTWSAKEMPILALAFIGDAIWHVYVRNHVMQQGARRPNELHRRATTYARASAQALALEKLTDELSEEEKSVAKRGRNAKTGRMGKSAEMIDYRHSTGFEALLGYVYGAGQTARLDQLCTRALAILDGESGGDHAENETRTE